MAFFLFFAFFLMPVAAFVLLFALTEIWIRLHKSEEKFLGLRLWSCLLFALIIWTMTMSILMIGG